jgi:hypothetical protein
MIQATFGLNWPSGFIGEDFGKSLHTDDGRAVENRRTYRTVGQNID